MTTRRSNLLFTTVLVFAAVVFGMVIAGGTRLTTPGYPATGPQRVVAGGGPSLPSFADLAEAVLPAVASVRVVTIETSDRGDSPFGFFFSDPRRRQPPDEPREYRSDGAGSAFVISADGWIVTNHHLIDGATTVEVTIEDRRYEAEIRGADELTDLAVLKVEASEEFKYLALGDSTGLRVGEWVMAIGNPSALPQSVTVGVVSAKNRSLRLQNDSSFENYIQTDAAINRGNSGGPLVNLEGEVVGISTAMKFGAENIGFAVPVNTLKDVVGQLQDTGRVRRGYLGVNINDLDEDAAEAFGRDSTDGALVNRVVAGGPADLAGLRNGDILVEVDDFAITNIRSLIDHVAAKPPGTEVAIRFVRNGRELTSEIVLGERDTDQVAAAVVEEDEDGLEWLGVQYQNLTPTIRESEGIDSDIEGVVVSDVAATSPLVDEGLAPGDVITEVDGEPVADADGFTARVSGAASGSLLRIYVRRAANGGETGFFAFVRVP